MCKAGHVCITLYYAWPSVATVYVNKNAAPNTHAAIKYQTMKKWGQVNMFRFIPSKNTKYLQVLLQRISCKINCRMFAFTWKATAYR